MVNTNVNVQWELKGGDTAVSPCINQKNQDFLLTFFLNLSNLKLMKTEALTGANISYPFSRLLIACLRFCPSARKRHVHPIDACLVVLPDELVKLAVALDPSNHLLALCLVAVMQRSAASPFRCCELYAPPTAGIEGPQSGSRC